MWWSVPFNGRIKEVRRFGYIFLQCTLYFTVNTTTRLFADQTGLGLPCLPPAHLHMPDVGTVMIVMTSYLSLFGLCAIYYSFASYLFWLLLWIFLLRNSQRLFIFKLFQPLSCNVLSIVMNIISSEIFSYSSCMLITILAWGVKIQSVQFQVNTLAEL